MIEKKPTSTGRSVRVTFSIPSESVQQSAAVVGDFNEWNEEKHRMKPDKKNGVWSRTVSLKPGNSYRFRYLVDGEWRNDSEADAYEASPHFSENCVIHV